MKTNQLIQFKNFAAFIVLITALSCFAVSPRALAQLSPAPDGGYPNANTAEGDDALFSLTDGGGNTAIGFDALYQNTGGGDNTAIGFEALYSNIGGNAIGGNSNTATGWSALHDNTTGSENTASGVNALLSNTSGNENTANGAYTLVGNTTGNYNTANGAEALDSNSTGNNNTASGFQALTANNGDSNTANGFQALNSNASGGNNTATGALTLLNNTSGFANTANGLNALQNNTTGNNNIGLGNNAGLNLTTGNNNIDIGNQGVAAESNTIRIGTIGTQTNAFMAGIFGATVTKGVSVVIDSTGHLGTKGSSERFKDAIKPMDKASEAILALKPVTFHYKKELDPEGIPQFGLIAEQVEKVNPALVARDDQGKVYTVRYDAINAMLLNEFLKEHRKVQKLEAGMEVLVARLKEQASEIQKVSTQLEVSKPAPQMVDNHR
jgi:trimeric autotransporter adhesin